MDAITAIKERASYRGQYDPAPVPRADLQAILEAGLAAPSGCNVQTTSLIAVDDPFLLQRLREVCPSKVGRSAPALLLVLTQRLPAAGGRCYSVQDYSAAIQNMLLALMALGYASCWVEGHVTGPDQAGRKMADVLGVPKDYELVCFLPVGKAAEPVQAAQKKPFSERAWFNGFGK